MLSFRAKSHKNTYSLNRVKMFIVLQITKYEDKPVHTSFSVVCYARV